MATSFITVKVNTAEIGKIREDWRLRLINLKKPMRQFLKYLELETKQQFVTQTTPEGYLWEDLKDETWAHKRSDTILREDSIMINSIYTRVRNLEGEIGLSDEKAVYHQFGTDKMPKREILGVPEERLQKGYTIFETYIGELMQ